MLRRAALAAILVLLLAPLLASATGGSTQASYELNGDSHELTGVLLRLGDQVLGGATFQTFPGVTDVTLLVNDKHAGDLVAIDACQTDASGACEARAFLCENGKLHLANDRDPVRVPVLSREMVHGCPLSLPAYPTGGEITALWS